jgi:hypothetical protein
MYLSAEAYKKIYFTFIKYLISSVFLYKVLYEPDDYLDVCIFIYPYK